MRKVFAPLLILALSFTSCNINEPLDYYNTAVTAENTSLGFYEFESRLERLESGVELEPKNLVETIGMRTPYNESVLEKLNGLVGNEESDPMIKAAIAYLKFDIDFTKNPKTAELFKIVGNAKTFEEAGIGLEPLGDYLDSMYNKREELWKSYNRQVAQYAAENDIEMKFYGPGAPSE